MSDPNEAMKAMAKRIASQFAESSENIDYEVHIALAAIMETQARDAALVEDGYRCRSCDVVFVGVAGHPVPECDRPDWDMLSSEQAATAIRAGEHYALAGDRHGRS